MTSRKWQRPFLKWAGGKYSQLADLFRLIPEGKRLIEPFVGGGSVFLNSDKHADFLLSDVNPDLINLYQMLAVVPDAVECQARWMFEKMANPEGYELIKNEFNAQTLDAAERAAAFLYLNRHCFNGLMRYNLAHQFNVGWGKYKAPYFPFDELKAFADMAHNCVFMTSGFSRTIGLAGAGDVVYCDPPYEPMYSYAMTCPQGVGFSAPQGGVKGEEPYFFTPAFKGNVKFDGLDYLYKEKFNNNPADGSNSTLGLRLLGNGGQRSDDLFYEKIGVFAARRFFIASGNNSCNIDMRQDGSIVSQHGTGNYVIYPDGNISGNAWGGYLRDFINNKFNGAYSASNPPPIASQAVTGTRLSGRTVQPDSGGRIDLPAGCVFTGMSGANYNAGTWAAYSAVQININGVWATVATV